MNTLASRPTLRKGERNEIPEIIAVSVAAYEEYRPLVRSDVFSAYIADLHQLPALWDEAEVLVVDLGGRIVGSVLFYSDASLEGLGLPAGWAGFRKLAVLPAYRGQSFGMMLVQACVERARQRAAPAVGIHTVSFMKSACRMYERIGFLRQPELDVDASDLLSVPKADPVNLIAYRLDLVLNLEGHQNITASRT